MNTINRPNRDALQKALDIYRDAMRPFLVRCLKQVRGTNVEDVISRSLGNRRVDEFERALNQPDSNVESAIDINDFPTLVSRNWHRETFDARLNSDKTFQNQLWLIADARNHVVHNGTQDLDDDYTLTHLLLIANVLRKIGASENQQAVQIIRDERFSVLDSSHEGSSPTTRSQTEQTPPQTEKEAQPSKPIASKLTAWRDVIRPNLEVAQGNFREADFAADLQQVHNERASAAGYGNPVSFFKQTYITPGIRTLLVNTLKRLSGKGGHPVIQTKTGFGGGKTHSLIALYHLVTSADALINPPMDGEHDKISEDIRDIMRKAGWDPDTGIQPKIAVLGGTYFSTTDSTVTENGEPLNTLWGIMAYQLGGQETYELVGQAARQGTAPGGVQLDQLFKHVGPCVILMDELVAYVRNAGSAKDNIYTFLQALTESVRRSKHVALVVTLPESQVEAGDEAGVEALSRLDSLFGRIEAIWKPLEIHEAFEVVRRRLFEGEPDPQKRDETCEAFARMYSRSRKEYPQGVSEQRYIERMKACYPIHPEIFDRLYHDWSTIPRFQRTRGVLRIMANCISHLYQARDAGPLIMPANLPLRHQTLAEEFIGLLTDQWNAVVTEVDSDNSLTYQMDVGSEPFGRVGGAAQRIARTVFLGSCPDKATKGMDARQIRLGVVEPGHGTPIYNDALSQMRGNLYYFYSDNDRYYFHVEENLNKVAADRADALTESEIHAEIVRQIETAVGRRSDVIICPENSEQIADSDKIKLVILPPDKTLNSRARDSDEATPIAEQFLRFCGDETTRRRYRNTILLLAAKREDMNTLKRSIRPYLAWHSIINGERKIQNLKGDRRRQATASLTTAGRELGNALVKAYRWAFAPTQPNPVEDKYQWNFFDTEVEQDGKIIESTFKRFVKEEILIEKISPSTLVRTLTEYIWDNPSYGDHIKIEELWDLLGKHIYLPRLKNIGVLLECIKQGVPENAFGYAESYTDSELRESKDERRGSYIGIRFGEDVGFVAIEGTWLLVNPDKVPTEPQEDTTVTPDPIETSSVLPNPDLIPPTPPQGSTHFIATKTMQGEISLDDINLLREEIIRTMQNDGGEISVTVTIEARKPDGFSENAARSIRQNSDALGVDLSETK